MARKNGLDFMRGFVLDYMNGGMDRMSFDLDFNHYLIKHYPAMERSNSGAAEAFAFYIAERGFDQALTLSDDEHMTLIRQQWGDFCNALPGDEG